MADRRSSFPGRVPPFPRALRVNAAIRQVLAVEIERLADADERLRLVTVTDVLTAPDLTQATVYLDSLGDEARAALGERRVQLQRAIGRQLRMKRTPRLGFAPDPAVAAGEAVEAVLRRLKGRSEPTGP
jgi:ribosome-binding factor A